FPDVLTGRNFAHAGITLGLVFGLAASTNAAVQWLLLNREAKKFANEYVEILKSGTDAEAFWYLLPADYRQEMTPRQAYAQMRRSTAEFQGRTAPIRRMRA